MTPITVASVSTMRRAENVIRALEKRFASHFLNLKFEAAGHEDWVRIKATSQRPSIETDATGMEMSAEDLVLRTVLDALVSDLSHPGK